MGEQGWREEEEEQSGSEGGEKTNTFHPFAMAAYFFVLIPARLLTSESSCIVSQWDRV